MSNSIDGSNHSRGSTASYASAENADNTTRTADSRLSVSSSSLSEAPTVLAGALIHQLHNHLGAINIPRQRLNNSANPSANPSTNPSTANSPNISMRSFTMTAASTPQTPLCPIDDRSMSTLIRRLEGGSAPGLIEGTRQKNTQAPAIPREISFSDSQPNNFQKQTIKRSHSI